MSGDHLITKPKAISIACVASVSVWFRSKERGTRVKDRAKNGASKRVGRGSFFGSCFISRAAKTENPVPRSFFVPKPNGNACYAGYNFNTYSFFSGCQFKNAIIAVLFFNETSFICHSFIWKGLNFSPQLKKKNNRSQLWKIMKSICGRDRLVVPTHYLQLRLLRKRKTQSHHTVSLTSSTRAAICLLLSNVRWHRGQPLLWTSSFSSLDTYLE